MELALAQEDSRGRSRLVRRWQGWLAGGGGAGSTMPAAEYSHWCARAALRLELALAWVGCRREMHKSSNSERRKDGNLAHHWHFPRARRLHPTHGAPFPRPLLLRGFPFPPHLASRLPQLAPWSSATQFAMSVLPRRCREALARGGVSNQASRWSSLMPQFVGACDGQGSRDSDEPADLDGMEKGGVGLLRNWVVPPTGFGGQLPQVLYPDAAQVNVEEERSDAMDSETYFTNLITNDFSPTGQSVNIPPHDGIAAHDEALHL